MRDRRWSATERSSHNWRRNRTRSVSLLVYSQSWMLHEQLFTQHQPSDRIIEDWRRQCDELSQETERSQQEARRNAADVYTLQTASTSLGEQIDDLRRENKNLSLELKDLNEQLGSGGRSAHDVGKRVRLLEMEKEELQHSLNEVESALEAEESKVFRLQTEVSQIRQDVSV